MTKVRHAIYLHGFASSPASSKAAWFAQALRARGVGFSCPDLNQPAFETLTVTRMIAQTHEAIAAAPDGPVALVGSSLGAFVAVHAAAADVTGRVDRLVLMAPALDFGGNRLRQLGTHGIDEWRRTRTLRVFHYADGVERDVDFALYEDAAAYDAFAVHLPLPILVVQGRQDDVVDPRMVERWASSRPEVDLRMVADGHQLSDSMPVIWEASARLFGLMTQEAARGGDAAGRPQGR
jgi:alpha-beta hydrolase superfamily lysophospholipase